MYSREERMKAIELYIKYNKSAVQCWNQPCGPFLVEPSGANVQLWSYLGKVHTHLPSPEYKREQKPHEAGYQ